MTRGEIISGLEFTVAMFLFDPSTGETYTEPRNDMDKTTIDACKGAIELLKREPFINKPCISKDACQHHTEDVLDKIKAEIEKDAFTDVNNSKFISVNRVNQIIDKYKAESEDAE